MAGVRPRAATAAGSGRTCRRAVRALRTAVLLPALLLGSAGLTPATASGATAADTAKGRSGYCPDGNGVTVVVDFQELGGGTVVRCAPGSQETGLAALKNAGFRITGTNRWGEAFICRIEGRPGAQSESCIDTPPASAYWGYWHATDGGSWKYSQLGATNRTPPPGSFEGWSFAKDKTESAPPPPGAAPRRPPTATTPPPGGGSGGSGGSNGGGQQGSSGGAAPGGETPGTGSSSAVDGMSPAPGETGRSGRPDRSASGEPSVSASAGPRADDGASPAPGDQEAQAGGTAEEPAGSGRGIPAGTAAAVAVIAVLAAGGGVSAWRRRRAAGADRSA